MDYRFHNLSSRSFEQLVHALAIKSMGLAIQPFGDGRDGGRDAAFEGRVQVPGLPVAWDGYGVIQAKFLQRPLGTEVDGLWALEQLAGELAKFADGTRKRRTVDYYIFVTNASLSAVPVVGHRDKAVQLLAEFARNIDAKGYDLWDYTKLCALLDNAPELSSAYDSWLMSGNILHRLINGQTAFPSNFPQVLTRALSLDLLDDQYAKLEQAGHTADERIPLATVFVDLPAISAENNLQDDNTKQPSFEGIVKYLVDESTVANDSGTMHVPSSVNRTVIIGGPGQGKTTVGQYLCQVNRASLLNDVDQAFLTPETKMAKNNIVSMAQEQAISLGRARRFPVHIILSNLATYLAQAPEYECSIFHYLAGRYSRRLKEPFEASHLRLWLNRAPCLVVLDGLDEVPSSSNREQVMRVVQEFIIDATSSAMDVMLLATTRPQGYNDDFDPKHYRHFSLTHLPPPIALQYGKRLAATRFGGESDRAAVVIERLEKALSQQSTARLMQTPLQVTIMTILVERTGQPPQEQWSLFNSYYNTIYERELSRDTPAASLLQGYRADIAVIHQNVALALQIRAERSGGTDAKMTRTEFEVIVWERLIAEGHDGDALEELMARIIDAAAQRLVFLVGIEEERIGFEIRSLQEFMAAEALHFGKETDVQARLQSISAVTSWRNVFLFAASRCFSRSQHLRDTIVMICHHLNEAVSEDWESARLHAGSTLALELLEEGSSRTQPRYKGHLFAVACELLKTDDLSISLRLIRVAEDLQCSDLYSRASEILRSEGSAPDVATGIIAMMAEKGVSDAYSLLEELSCRSDLRNKILRVSFRLKLHVLISKIFVEYAEKLDLSGNLTLYPPDGLLRTLDTSEWPKWAIAALELFTRPYYDPESTLRASITLEFTADIGLSMVILPCRDTSLADLADIPKDAHPSWTPLKAAGAFVKNPCPSSLAAVLNAGAPDNLGLFEGHVPWLVEHVWSLALWDADSNIIDADIRSGRWGDASDWDAAEQRWRSGQARIEDLSVASPTGIGIDIATVGVPFVGLLGLSGLTRGLRGGNSRTAAFVIAHTELPAPVRWALAARVLYERAFSGSFTTAEPGEDFAALLGLVGSEQPYVMIPISIDILLKIALESSLSVCEAVLGLAASTRFYVFSPFEVMSSKVRQLVSTIPQFQDPAIRVSTMALCARFIRLTHEDIEGLSYTVDRLESQLDLELCRIAVGSGDIARFIQGIADAEVDHRATWLRRLMEVVFLATTDDSRRHIELASAVSMAQREDGEAAMFSHYFDGEFNEWLAYRWKSRTSGLDQRTVIEHLSLPSAVLLTEHH